ncbi:uncharacterized protein LOC125864025 [Solanum stenotomum]|uniref:uncharacterized protein LOC125864025 n=1 Tax=Solanum stenotomum TaxID=172797 RepID=UPI0020D13845|nr:uncharacterized protein LOC125864025 [Solanum stenotomum]
MNPPGFKGSSTAEDPGNFIKELQKVFEVMHVVDAKRVELASYQLKCNTRTWFDQWKKSRADDAPILSWIVFESAFLGSFFPRELREAKKKRPTPSSASAPAPNYKGDSSSQNSQNFKAKPAESQGVVAQGGNWAPTCVAQGNGNRGKRTQSSSVTPPDRATPRGATSGTGGEANR